MRQQERSGLRPESINSNQQQYSRVAPFNSEFDTTQKPQRLHQFFERRCDIAPKALALVCDTASFSYLELDELANRLANYLSARGLSIGKRIGILLDRSVHTYVALLAVLKCGAAFVPLDPSFPSERINFIAADAALDLLLTTSKFKDTTSNLCCPVLELDTNTAEIDQQPATRVKLALLREDDLCYIIYTSGSTGRPKGVAVNHSSICNFLTVCTPIYGVTASDRVYQGMIMAFDFSIEEIWPTFVVGATLIAGPTDQRKLGSELADFLIEQEVTVMYCVPTLLATLDCDVPSIRTLIVGGEACPQDLVKRWSRPHRRILNTYGPTEATVTALWTELLSDRPVTIGVPLPTYCVYLLDDDLRRVTPGEPGEICIGGVGVACGYVNLPEMTATKFIDDPFAVGSTPSRLYKTGDLGRVTSNGEIEYLGRIDNQVKIRGYRIELTEIEAVLLEDAEIENAIVALDKSAIPELVAYLTLRDPRTESQALKLRLHTALRDRLPSYMLPAFIEILEVLPTLPNGKVDRSKLPLPTSSRLNFGSGKSVTPATPLEQELATAWSQVFRYDNISVEDDFFNDLGGHSLFAAQVISALRQNPALHSLSIADLYSHPTIGALAHHIEQTSLHQIGSAPQRDRPKRYSDRQVWACGTIQLGMVCILLALLGAPSVWLMSKASYWDESSFILTSLILIPTSWFVFSLVLPVAAKWLLIGRFRPGRYPLWGWYYCRWWLVRKIMTLAPLNYLAGSPLMPFYLRLLGARVGKGCQIATSQIHLPDLIAINDGASIGYGVELQPFTIEGGWLYQAPIQIGSNALVGTNAVVMLGSSLGQGAVLAEQSLAAQNQKIPQTETWEGSPSKRTTNIDPVLTEMSRRKPLRSNWSLALWLGFTIGFFCLEMLPLLMFLPGLLFEYVVAKRHLLWGLAAAPISGTIFVLTACLFVAIGKKLVTAKARPGIFPLYSKFGLQKWLADKLMMTSLAVTNTLYATLYTLPWLRLLGAKIGPRSEVSTVSHIDPELLTLGQESFVADIVTIGPAKYCNGFFALGVTELGDRTFAGNAALIPGGTYLGDNSLIGVHSTPPAEPVKPGTSWLGSPAIFLPRRQQSDCFAETLTFRPPAKLVACRLAIEFLRIILPPTLIYVLIVQDIFELIWLVPILSTPVLVLVLPLLHLSSALFMTILVAALKWLIIGQYRPRVKPLWSNFVWRTELIAGLYESVAVPLLIVWFTGTPFLAPLLRLFGTRMGRRVYCETTFITEFDLVRVADDAAIGGLTSLQTHLFEDRVMKMSYVQVGRGCTIGPRSVVLYDSVMEAGAKLDALSLLMKSEVLPSQSTWQGIPARLVH